MKPVLITSALPYINGIKHLGNLVGSMLPADIYARFLRQKNHEVLYICATDEHGTPAEIAAQEAGLEVSEFCRIQHDVQQELGEKFGLSWDYFGRSSSDENTETTQHFFSRLLENGLIEERVIQQVYSLDDERFLPDRYIVGTCPHCGDEGARGDQCEACTRVLDPTDLIDARSAISGSKNLEVRETRHMFLLQSKLEEELRTWVESKDNWPLLTTSIAKKWLDEGLKDRCITRDLKWGVPVNLEGFEDKVFYVWYDAPMEYISATKEWAAEDSIRDWKKWWYDTDVEYVQFMAKDNVPFHTIIWPSSIIGSREPWVLPTYIKAFNWLTYKGGKFSTSSKRGVFMSHALELLPADYWRYYLTANAPESNDSDFTWEHFGATCNKDLADVFGNFVNRTLKFANSKFDGVVPEGGQFTEEEETLFNQLSESLAEYEEALYGLKYRKAAQSLRAMWVLGNNYLANAAPWTVFKTDKDRAACIIRTAIHLIAFYSIISRPIIPETCEKLEQAIGDFDKSWPDVKNQLKDFFLRVPAGQSFTIPDVLFAKLTPEQLQEWDDRFAGNQ